MTDYRPRSGTIAFDILLAVDDGCEDIADYLEDVPSAARASVSTAATSLRHLGMLARIDRRDYPHNAMAPWVLTDRGHRRIHQHTHPAETPSSTATEADVSDADPTPGSSAALVGVSSPAREGPRHAVRDILGQSGPTTLPGARVARSRRTA